MTIIENHADNRPAPRPTPRPAGLRGLVPTVPIRPDVSLPRRFDVHRIDSVLGEMAEQTDSPSLHVDGSLVEMIDLAALRSLEDAAAERSIRIVQPSVALRMTVEYTGHRGLESCFTSAADLDEVA